MEKEKYQIPLFDGTTYGNWKFRTETLLDELYLFTPIKEIVNFEDSR